MFLYVNKDKNYKDNFLYVQLFYKKDFISMSLFRMGKHLYFQ